MALTFAVITIDKMMKEAQQQYSERCSRAQGDTDFEDEGKIKGRLFAAISLYARNSSAVIGSLFFFEKNENQC